MIWGRICKSDTALKWNYVTTNSSTTYCWWHTTYNKLLFAFYLFWVCVHQHFMHYLIIFAPLKHLQIGLFYSNFSYVLLSDSYKMEYLSFWQMKQTHSQLMSIILQIIWQTYNGEDVFNTISFWWREFGLWISLREKRCKFPPSIKLFSFPP